VTDLGGEISPLRDWRGWWERERRRPTGGSPAARIAQISRRRDVLRMLVARDLKRKYATSYLGYVWTLLEPALLIGVYWLVWGHVARLHIQHYVVFIAVGLIPFQWFRQSVNGATGVLTGNGRLISSISLPREMYPLAFVLMKTIEFLITLPIVVALALAYGLHPNSNAIYLPLAFIIELVMITGLALLLSSLNTLFKDIDRALGVVMRLLFYLTPVLYPTSRLHGKIREIYNLNPMVGIIDMHRSVWFPKTVVSPHVILISAIGAIVAFVAGWATFIRVEPSVLKEL
jgi:ABC-2 type transport system permease protein